MICYVSLAQQKSFSINWKAFDASVASDESNVDAAEISKLSYNSYEKIFVYQNRWRENQGLRNFNISQVELIPASAAILEKLEGQKVLDNYSLEYFPVKARGVTYASIAINPVVKKNGIIQLVKSFVVTYQAGNVTARNSEFTNFNTLSNSIFSTGNWYKFYIDQTGVQKITKDFLSSLGMDVSSIDPNLLKIVGHGGEMLPLLNAENEFYDPPEVSIKIVGGEDGSFDAGDYILFYGTAADGQWNDESDTNLNLYAERSYYYVSADGATGNRVGIYSEPAGSASQTITTFDDRQYYEVDDYNVANLGRRWVGDRFDFENERTYEFNFPNLVQSEPIQVEVYGVGVSEVNTSLNYSLNGTDLGSLNFSSISDNRYASGRSGEYNTTVNSDDLEVTVTYNNSGNPASVAYLDYINISVKRNLIASNRQFKFKNQEVALNSGVGEYVIQNAAQILEVWDVTNPQQVLRIPNANSVETFSFKVNLGEVREYVALVGANFYSPKKEGKSLVNNVNLKGNVFLTNGNEQDVDYLMVTSSLLFSQATRLAEYRAQKDDLNIKVVKLEEIYQEFNSGKQDVSAIRNFVKYIYDNAVNSSSKIKYLCLFGDASVDYKDRLQNNNNVVPTYERLNGFSSGSASYASDDFYGMMDAGETVNNGMLDIAIGRILADSPATAKTLVDKIIAYENEDSYGAWRNNFVLISDDADESGAAGYGLQVQLDAIGDDISTNKPFINVKKIHSDAFQQISSAGGFRYPEVNKSITEAVEVGAAVVNYFGHGGENGLAAERIVTVEDIVSWKNTNKYNLFVTVTCEFTRFDNPARLSPGEYNLLNNQGGSVAMVTTTRSILVSTGTNFNNLIAPYLFNYAGGDDSVAEAVRKAKNDIGGLDVRVVFYFGDPAMKLQLAEPQIKLTTINELPVSQTADTLKALSYVKLGGEVQDQNGNLLTNYNGDLATSIFDKRIDRNTLNNDGQGVFEFTTLGEIVFRGNASVNNGKFNFDFVVPKDIAIPVGSGRISFYAKKNNVLQDQRGYDNELLIGGINENAPEDNIGPEIQLYMNDESFVSGGITNNEPILLVKLSDENGINTASGIGHDLVAILDGDETEPFVVNDYYETELDDYTKGTVNYKLRDLEEGLHTLSFKAWDVYNNSSIAEIQFRVSADDELKIDRVLNYPNPFHNYTEFWFNHNRPYEPLEVQVQVLTVSGKIVWTKNQTITTDGFLAREITWNGKDDFGDAIGKGVYIYKLTVKSTLTNKKVEKFEKLVIL
ncbi:type IX secretion system sortase PorU [Mesonia aestuariivivens]|nr:type IX secretion system sortase PorU [Mesonia aestuariivivens]